METRPVSRCIAIAAHGKRCQQSPFRGSPYCWHHNQSRKVWPPSRPPDTAGRVTVRTAEPEDAAMRQAREASREHSREALSRRLLEILDDEALGTLVAFLESGYDATAILAREGGHLAVAVDAAERQQRASR